MPVSLDSGLSSPLTSPQHSPAFTPIPTESAYLDLLAAKELDCVLTEQQLSQRKLSLLALQRDYLSRFSALLPEQPAFQPCSRLSELPRLLEDLFLHVEAASKTQWTELKSREKAVQNHMEDEGKRLDSVRKEVERAIQALAGERTALERTRAEAEELSCAVQAELASVARERELMEDGAQRREQVLLERIRRVERREQHVMQREDEVVERLQILETEMRKLATEREQVHSLRVQQDSDSLALHALSQRLSEAKTSLARLQETQSSSLSQREAAVRERELSFQQQEARLKAKYEEAEQQCARLSNDIRATSQYKAALERRSAAISEQENRLQAALKAVKGGNEAVSDWKGLELTELRRVCERLESENTALRTSSKLTNSSFDQQSLEIRIRENELSQQEAALRAQAQALQSLQHTLETKAKAVEAQEQASRSREIDLDRRLEACEKLKNGVIAEQSRLEAMEIGLKEREEKLEIEKKRGNSGNSQSVLEAIHAEINKARDKVMQDKKAVEEDQSRMQALIKELEEEGQKVQKKQQQLVALNRELLTREREMLRREKEMKLQSVWDDPIVRLSEGFLLED